MESVSTDEQLERIKRQTRQSYGTGAWSSDRIEEVEAAFSAMEADDSDARTNEATEADEKQEIADETKEIMLDRHTPEEIDEMIESGTITDRVDEVVGEVMSDDDTGGSDVEHPTDRYIADGAGRTNVSDVPTGEWDDHSGPTDEWGNWLNQTDEAGQTERTNDETPSGQMTTGSSRDNSETANMMGVPQQVERDTAGLGDEDVSDVPTGEVWADVSPNTARLNEADDIADEDMPDGEWPNETDAERLSRVSGDATNIYQNMQLGDNNWEQKDHIERENGGLSRHEVHEGLTELVQLDLIDRDETARPTLYRMPE